MTDPNTVMVLVLIILMAYLINDALQGLRGALLRLIERINKLEKQNEKRS